MPAEPRRGMDHALYPFSPLPARRPLAWPGGKPLAVALVVHLDRWELQQPKDAHRAPDVHGMWGNQFPDLRTYTYRLYGERIGVFRILDVLASSGVRATVAAGAEICRLHPRLVERAAAAGHEIAAHGTHATRMLTSRMSEDQEREFIAESIDAVERACAVRPRGWFGQDSGESTRTPALLAAAGMRYVADWPNDEQPYWMSVEPPLVSLPVQAELDDLQLLWLRQQPTWRYPQLVAAAAERLARDGAVHARCLVLGVRTWLFGRAHRIRYLADTLGRLVEHPGVWVATADEVASAFAAASPAPCRGGTNR